MSAREQILASIRLAGTNRPSRADAGRGVTRDVPAARIAADVDSLWTEFARRAAIASATSARIGSPVELPGAVARYLRENGLAMRVCAEADLPRVDWAAAGVQASADRPRTDGDTLVTACFAGIAGEGALALLSGGTRAVEHGFLAETHIAVLTTGDLVSELDDLWVKFRLRSAAYGMPRTLNIVLGPSRTADLGVPSRLGAHGPRRLHVIAVESR